MRHYTQVNVGTMARLFVHSGCKDKDAAMKAVTKMTCQQIRAQGARTLYRQVLGLCNAACLGPFADCVQHQLILSATTTDIRFCAQVLQRRVQVT